MCDVIWCGFTWEAFAGLMAALAALLAGVLAVGAAIHVAQWQRKIAERQTELLAAQAEIAHATLVNGLFDRRVQVYRAVRKYLGTLVAEGEAPPPRSRT